MQLDVFSRGYVYCFCQMFLQQVFFFIYIKVHLSIIIFTRQKAFRSVDSLIVNPPVGKLASPTWSNKRCSQVWLHLQEKCVSDFIFIFFFTIYLFTCRGLAFRSNFLQLSDKNTQVTLKTARTSLQVRVRVYVFVCIFQLKGGPKEVSEQPGHGFILQLIWTWIMMNVQSN